MSFGSVWPILQLPADLWSPCGFQSRSGRRRRFSAGHESTNMRHRQKLELGNPTSIRIEIVEQEAINAIA
jgi:hypothetical protein